MSEQASFPVQRALISVSDKTSIASFCAYLHELGVEIISTGGTATFLRDRGIPVISVSDVTGFPEIMEGRVKTLHPAIHGGILANLSLGLHQDALTAHNFKPIGLVIINLYPFEKTSSDEKASFDEIIENIDIGGPAMLRAAAKNHAHVTVLTDPADYDHVIEEMKAASNTTSLKTRQWLAAKAFARTAAYDSAISNWFAVQENEAFPATHTITGQLVDKLRYGENPHQEAALYRIPKAQTTPNLVDAQKVQGKELSYNNLTDADAAFDLVSDFDDTIPVVAIIKHANPSGVALGETVVNAYRKARACDPVSAFGGIVASNKPLDAEAAQAILELFTEVVIAPDASAEAKQAFAKKPNIRLLLTNGLSTLVANKQTFRSISGGFLVQDADDMASDPASIRRVTAQAPSDKQQADLIFAMKIAKHVRSNAIVFVKNGQTLGIGAGQMSRIDSVRIACLKARDMAKHLGLDPDEFLKGSALASDAFFPFADGIIAAIEAGATSIIQPGGSIRDEDVIATADERGISMMFTGVRHFRH